jgi:hypothetical protein
MRQTIAWIADQPGWAYDNRAKRLSALLPEYDHVIVMNPMARHGESLVRLASADLIVCPDPRLLPVLPWRDNVLLHLNALKIFD